MSYEGTVVNTDFYQAWIPGNQKPIVSMASVSTKECWTDSLFCQVFSVNVTPPLIQLRQYQFQHQWTISTVCLPTQFNLWEKKVQSNNHIPPLVLSLSLSHFLEGPIHRPGTILPYPERLQTLQLLNGWEQASLSFLWVTQLAMERPGPASFLFRLCLMASQCHDFTHTHYQPIAMQNSIFSSNHAPSQTAG